LRQRAERNLSAIVAVDVTGLVHGLWNHVTLIAGNCTMRGAGNQVCGMGASTRRRRIAAAAQIWRWCTLWPRSMTAVTGAAKLDVHLAIDV
jgi:hypothetical protein